MAYTMAVDGTNISASLGTVEFEGIGAGTRLIYTEQGAFFDGGDGPSSRKQGVEWTPRSSRGNARSVMTDVSNTQERTNAENHRRRPGFHKGAWWLIPNMRSWHAHHPQVAKHLTRMNRFVVCHSQNEICRIAHITLV